MIVRMLAAAFFLIAPSAAQSPPLVLNHDHQNGGRSLKAGATKLDVNSQTPANGAATGQVDIQTSDVELFYRVYDAALGRPSVDQIQREYLDAGSEGLRTFIRARNTTAQRIVEAIAEQPDLYAGGRRCAQALTMARPRLEAALQRLQHLYPPTRSPPITVVIGRGRPVGVGSPVNGLQIGLEALCGVRYYSPDPVDRFVYVVAHEYVHVQQAAELVDNDANWTVLEGSLAEGAADFVGELISGGLGNPQLALDARGREREIEEPFVRDMHRTDLSGWLNDGTMERSGNLGYWVGYRIVRSYYERAPDKAVAIRAIIEMRDAEAFFAQSGWSPGMTFDRSPPQG